jgi:hypothetical protein
MPQIDISEIRKIDVHFADILEKLVSVKLKFGLDK